MLQIKFLLLSGLLLAATCVASSAPIPTAAPAPHEVEQAFKEREIEKRAATCTFSGSLGYSLASVSKASCSTIILDALTVPAGKTLDMTDLPDSTVVIFQGETSFAYSEWVGPLFAVSGTNIKVSGEASGGSILNGNGASYWDGGGGSSGVTKPKFFQAHDLTDSLIETLTILNPPVQVFSINGASNLELAYITIDGSAGDSLGKNTDGFDIGSSDTVTIGKSFQTNYNYIFVHQLKSILTKPCISENATVYNQDDCVAINSGTNIIFKNGYCSGGHGLSIGSVGGRTDNTVDGVSFLTSTVTKSVNGIRIKAIEGDTGTITNVEYDDITLSSISKYGILIEQNYDGGDLDGGTASSGVPITDLTIKNIIGTGAVSSSGYDVVITCGSSGCSSWTWSSVAVTGGKKYGSCTNVPSVAACS
ncbi:putative endopolygalacturonase [Lachnellula subtilissima]|uniref:Putative endopolygalacturonase n=1 Tax=Lachnellula subtilissima TaxID=602034 RepID=A0A8H8UE78_9HELO|nr:putative endopolygalacturonase [Lachnellula subtilissima]